ncbi:unnamed protein product [marine sediment metagenome]|uniref:Uncharacterized protein n=1 Tax=marine sediment metagenome TaxID=412755 RepID=X1SLM4_9ZZZZ
MDEPIVLNALAKMNVGGILPFRFIGAARYAPQWEEQIEEAMMRLGVTKEQNIS